MRGHSHDILRPGWPGSALNLMKKSVPIRVPWIMYYDGQCRLCTGVVRILRLLDVTSTLRYRSYQDLETPPRGLSWHDLERSAYLVTSTGKAYEGFFAFRMLALKMPAFLLLSPLLWFPGVGTLGKAVYRWVADNRHRLSSCRGHMPKPSPR